MKVLWREVGSAGITVLNPVRLPDIIRNSPYCAGAGVLTGDCLVVTTRATFSHEEAAEAAGIELEDLDVTAPVAGQGHLRLQLNDVQVEVEIKLDEDLYDDLEESGRCPLQASQLAPVAAWVSAHPRIRDAFAGGPSPKVVMTLLCQGIPFWTFEDGAIKDADSAPHTIPDTTPGRIDG